MTTFVEIGVRKDVLQGLEKLGFSIPTPVQEQIIPLMFAKQDDLVGLAQTGTGKTAAFGIPLIQGIEFASKKTQALVLCPTRELCVQVARDMSEIGSFVPGLKILAVYGGASMVRQIQELRQGVQVIVATPGRLHDLIRQGYVDISAIRAVVLDEADEMLNMGFQEELNAILAKTPAEKRTLLFSATMPREVAAIAKNYMKKPLEITVGERNAGAENIRHLYYTAHAKDRYLVLKRIVDMNPDVYAIIFCRTRQETQDVADKLVQDGYSADALHGDLSQGQRDHVMSRFRRRNLQMLVATDVAARGLDVKDITHVIHYNLPDEAAIYTHRSGRTGRAGKAGISVAIINMREKHRIREIEAKLKKRFEQCRIPTGKEICEKQLLGRMDAWLNIDVNYAGIEPFLPIIVEKLAGLDREALIKRIVAGEFNRFLEYYRNAPDLNIVEIDKGRPSRGKEGGDKFSRPSASRVQYTRFFLNVGKKDGISPSRLIGEINDAVSGQKIAVGKIEIMGNSAMFEADSNHSGTILDAFRHVRINGKPVVVKVGEYKPREREREQRPRKEGERYIAKERNKRETPARPKWKSKGKSYPRQVV